MKKEQPIISLLCLSSFLVGCSKSLGRVEAIETLDGIVLKVQEKSFKAPETYSASYQVIDSVSFTERKVSLDIANTAKNRYIHSKSVSKTYESDPKSGDKVPYTVSTIDSFFYLDPLASEKTFISYTSVLEENVSSNASSSKKAEPSASFIEVKGDDASSLFEEAMEQEGDNVFVSAISSIPSSIDAFLKGLSYKPNIYVKSSLYQTTGEGNLELYIVTNENGQETSMSASFDDSLVKQYEKVWTNGSETMSFNWNSVKYIYPDLSKATSMPRSSVNSNFEN